MLYRLQLIMISAKIKKRFCRRMPIIFSRSKLFLAFFLHQANFPSSRKFSIRKYFYSINDVSLIREFFCKQVIFVIMKVFLKLSLKMLHKNISNYFVVKRLCIFNTNNKLLTVGLCKCI